MFERILFILIITSMPLKLFATSYSPNYDPSNQCAVTSVDESPDEKTLALAKELDHKFGTYVMTGDSEGFQSMLAPYYQSVHGDGARNKDQDTTLIEKMYKLAKETNDQSVRSGSNFIVKRGPDDILVITHRSIVQTVDSDGRLSNIKSTPNLTVWKKNDKGVWQVIAHAGYQDLPNFTDESDEEQSTIQNTISKYKSCLSSCKKQKIISKYKSCFNSCTK